MFSHARKFMWLALALLAGCDGAIYNRVTVKEQPLAKPPRWQKGSPEAEAVLANAGSAEPRSAKAIPLENATIRAKRWRPDLATSSESSGGEPIADRSASQAVKQISQAVQRSLEVGPTLLVWVIDQSPSASRLVSSASQGINYWQNDEVLAAAMKDGQLKFAIASYQENVAFALDPPTNELAALQKGFAELKSEPDGRELTFTAISQTLEKYASFRQSGEGQVVLAVVTDEPGDDLAKLDDAVALAKKFAIPVYVLGYSATLGRSNDIADSSKTNSPDHRTPATDNLYNEMPDIEYWPGSDNMGTAIDSGRGPWGLERLCRASAGQFLTVAGGERSYYGPQFNRETLEKYAPDYVSQATYQQLLAENKCRAALVEAAKLDRIEAMRSPTLYFTKGNNEGRWAQLLNTSQRAAALVEPRVEKMYEVLAAAEGDRSKLTGLRWQAAYDTAYGRVLAAKSRVDGYNAMLAALKRGKTFINPQATTWVLTPSTNGEGDSSLKKVAEKAKTYLERVQTEHPGTPWAKMAESELKTPLGWAWGEQ